MSLSRRDFVAGAGALGAAWLAAAVACREQSDADATSHAARPDSTAPAPTLGHFSAEEGAEVEAMASRIIPTDETPGAKEAGVLYFIDRSLQTFAADQKGLFADGLRDMAKRVAAKHPGQARFSALAPAQQDDLLRDVEKGEFFGLLRFATIAGFLALPKYGGNRDYIGWKLMGQEAVLEYAPPFGWYDRPETQRALLGRVL